MSGEPVDIADLVRGILQDVPAHPYPRIPAPKSDAPDIADWTGVINLGPDTASPLGDLKEGDQIRMLGDVPYVAVVRAVDEDGTLRCSIEPAEEPPA